MRKIALLFITFFLFNIANGQYPPQAMQVGSDAIHADDTGIVAWATGCTVKRGWMNIMDTTLGKTSVGTSSDALGAPGLTVLSLGDGGEATLTFDYLIKDGPGADFAVFENGFLSPTDSQLAFLELAYVAVSSDGINFITFPSVCLIPDSVQKGSFEFSDARLIHNLAGKHINGFGTPFDLAELADSPNLDIQNVRFIRITDVVGSIDEQFARYDSEGRKINDPFPTDFPSGGFDLNAIGVFHINAEHSGIEKITTGKSFKLWPIPAKQNVTLQYLSGKSFQYVLYDLNGKVLKEGAEYDKVEINIQDLSSGSYFIKCIADKKTETLILNKW